MAGDLPLAADFLFTEASPFFDVEMSFLVVRVEALLVVALAAVI